MGKQYAQQISSHGRNNSSDVQGRGRHDEFLKDQKLQAAENAIADQYATAMLSGIGGRGQFMTNTNEEGESMAAIGALSQSYRNVGAVHQKHNSHHTMSNSNQSTNQYERVRNSYQSPTNKFSGNISHEMISGVAMNSFNHQKSPKVGAMK